MNVIDYRAADQARRRVMPGLLFFGGVYAVSLVLVGCLMLHPEGDAGSFFAPEVRFALLVQLISFVAGVFICVGFLKRGRIWAGIFCLLLSLGVFPVFGAGYAWVDSFKHFNFGPG